MRDNGTLLVGINIKSDAESYKKTQWASCPRPMRLGYADCKKSLPMGCGTSKLLPWA